MGFALACFITSTIGRRGLWVSDDFDIDGSVPNWRAIEDGLFYNGEFVAPNTMCVNPDDPYNMQFLNCGSKIYKRDTSIGDGFRLVFTMQDAIDLVGPGPFDPPASPALTWITSDPTISGRYYTVYSYRHGDAAWYKPTWHRLWPGGYVLASDDYGETWYSFAPLVEPNPELRVYTPTRGANEVSAYGGYVWTAVSLANLYGEGAVTYPAGLTGDPGFPSRPMGGLGEYISSVKVNPHEPDYSYSGGIRDAVYSYGVWKVSSVLGEPNFLAKMFVPSPHLLFSENEHLSSDRHWINPYDNNDHIMICRGGRLYFGGSDLVFSGDDIVMHSSTTVVGNVQAISSDNYNSIYYMATGSIFGLSSRESRSPINLSDPGMTGLVTNYGLYVDPGSPGIRGHPYVFSVELGTEGSDDMTSSGRRLMGSDSAFNTIQQSDLHGRDIKELTPTVHAPWPANFGEAPVSDGEKYVATPVLTVSGMVIRYPNDGGIGEVYEFSSAGVNLAGEDSSAGDKIEITGAGQIDGEITLADQVEYKSSKSVVFTSTIVSGYGTILEGFTIRVSSNDIGNCVGVMGGESGSCRMIHCDVYAYQSGAGNAYAISANNGGGFECEDCNLLGSSTGGEGYAGRSIRGKIRAIGGSTTGSTDNFFIGSEVS
jgi:hypothetical protein